MQYLWAVTFVTRQASLRWPRGLARRGIWRISDTITHHLVRILSPASSAQRYSSSCDRSKLQALLLSRAVSERFMVIYVVRHARSCRFFPAGAMQFLLQVSDLTTASTGLSLFLPRPKCEFPCHASYVDAKRPKSTAPWGKTGMNLIGIRASDHSFTGANLRWKSYTPDSLKHSSALALPQWAHSQCCTIVTSAAHVAPAISWCLNYSGPTCPDFKIP